MSVELKSDKHPEADYDNAVIPQVEYVGGYVRGSECLKSRLSVNDKGTKVSTDFPTR